MKVAENSPKSQRRTKSHPATPEGLALCPAVCGQIWKCPLPGGTCEGCPPFEQHRGALGEGLGFSGGPCTAVLQFIGWDKPRCVCEAVCSAGITPLVFPLGRRSPFSEEAKNCNGLSSSRHRFGLHRSA